MSSASEAIRALGCLLDPTNPEGMPKDREKDSNQRPIEGRLWAKFQKQMDTRRRQAANQLTRTQTKKYDDGCDESYGNITVRINGKDIRKKNTSGWIINQIQTKNQ